MVRLLYLSAPFLAFFLVAPFASAACPERPQSDYEQAFCQIRAKGGGAALPTFEDFRRNTPQVQALLLKRPAARWGVALPEPASQPGPASDTGAPSVPSREPAEPAAPEPPQVTENASGLSACDLEMDTVRCSDGLFRLAVNQPNGALAPGVLDANNRLGLSPFRGDAGDEAAVRAYLSDAYDRYIAKMLEIGLGGATMSFTRFYNSFHRHRAEGVDFAQRMEDTFRYLKQDKRNLAVDARLAEGFPASMENCARSGEAVIVCDNVATNWVYVRD